MSQILANFPEYLPGESSGSSGALIREIELWIESLPLVNVGETYHLAIGALTKTNDANFPPQEHFKVLELFRAPIQYLGEALKNHLLSASSPLSLKARKIVAQLYDLHLAMAKGYQGIINESFGLNSHRQDFALLATCMHRALFYLGEELLTAYQVYEAGAPGRWRSIHRLYDAAEWKGVQSSSVKDPYRQAKQETSVEEQYAQLLLLALADPYRHSPPDIALIYRLLEQWAPRCRISSPDDFDESSHNFIIDLDGDEPPIRLTNGAVPQHSTCRLLDTGAMIRFLENQLSRIPTEPSKRPSSHHDSKISTSEDLLLQSVLAAWRPSSGRSFSRVRRGLDEVEVSLGLNANHEMLARQFSSAGDSGGSGARPPFERKTSLPAKTAGDQMKYFCSVINESAGGTRLRWNGTGEGNIRVGELLAFRHPHQPEDSWNLAAIRWLKSSNSRTVEFGIQHLSPNAMPVSIRLEKAQGGETEHDYLKGFYLPELKAIRQPASLIVPSLLFHANDVIALKTNHQEHYLRLVNAIDSTPIFSRFQFVAADIATDRTISASIPSTKRDDRSIRSNL